MTATGALLSASYGDGMAGQESETWPSVGLAFLGELSATRGRVGLIAAGSLADADDLVERFRTDLAVVVVRLGATMSDRQRPPSASEIAAACGNATVIADIDVLFWPEMNLAPLQLLAVRARRRPTIAVWPGHISGGRATYSAPGRPDHHDIVLHDVVVLRPRITRFPDETPFTIERTAR